MKKKHKHLKYEHREKAIKKVLGQGWHYWYSSQYRYRHEDGCRYSPRNIFGRNVAVHYNFAREYSANDTCRYCDPIRVYADEYINAEVVPAIRRTLSKEGTEHKSRSRSKNIYKWRYTTKRRSVDRKIALLAKQEEMDQIETIDQYDVKKRLRWDLF